MLDVGRDLKINLFNTRFYSHAVTCLFYNFIMLRIILIACALMH